jgi:heme oxygenase (biliverdin-producing, ferredoxin)
MEDALDHHHDHPVLSPLDFPELRRVRSLDADLAFFRGPTWSTLELEPPPSSRSRSEVSAATQRYVGRIRTIAYDRPELLVGHLYTRYLGDLSGGQILGRIAARALGVDPEKNPTKEQSGGVAFYRFDAIPDPRAFKLVYRQRLDALPIDAKAADAIVQEALLAFRMNLLLFEELEGSLQAALGSVLWAKLTRKGDRPATSR